MSRFEWAGSQAYAVEYSPDPDRLELLPEKVLPFVRSDIQVRFHTRYFKYEIGHADKYEAGKALEVHRKTLEKIHGLGEPVVTVHTGNCTTRTRPCPPGAWLKVTCKQPL